MFATRSFIAVLSSAPARSLRPVLSAPATRSRSPVLSNQTARSFNTELSRSFGSLILRRCSPALRLALASRCSRDARLARESRCSLVGRLAPVVRCFLCQRLAPSSRCSLWIRLAQVLRCFSGRLARSSSTVPFVALARSRLAVLSAITARFLIPVPSLPSARTVLLPIGGSLGIRGALRCFGSLLKHGALIACGSLGSAGALAGCDSLPYCGALRASDSLCRLWFSLASRLARDHPVLSIECDPVLEHEVSVLPELRRVRLVTLLLGCEEPLPVLLVVGAAPRVVARPVLLIACASDFSCSLRICLPPCPRPTRLASAAFPEHGALLAIPAPFLCSGRRSSGHVRDALRRTAWVEVHHTR